MEMDLVSSSTSRGVSFFWSWFLVLGWLEKMAREAMEKERQVPHPRRVCIVAIESSTHSMASNKWMVWKMQETK